MNLLKNFITQTLKMLQKILPMVAPLSSKTIIVGILDRRHAHPSGDIPSASTASGSAPNTKVHDLKIPKILVCNKQTITLVKIINEEK